MATSVMSVPGRRSTASAARREGSARVVLPPPGRELSGGARMPRSLASSSARANDRSSAVSGGQAPLRSASAASAGEPASDSERSAGRRASNLQQVNIHHIVTPRSHYSVTAFGQ